MCSWYEIKPSLSTNHLWSPEKAIYLAVHKSKVKCSDSMPLPLASDSVTDISREKLTQLAYLCVLLGAINETCKSMENRTYSSGNQNCDTSLTEFQIFLNLLAQILDTQKGNTTITALACLIGLNGTEFVFCSNFRKETELEHTKAFLSRMLDFVSTNPEKLATMALRKKVLWIILEYNSKRVTYYLNSLSSAVEECILNYQEREELEGKCDQNALRFYIFYDLFIYLNARADDTRPWIFPSIIFVSRESKLLFRLVIG